MNVFDLNPSRSGFGPIPTLSEHTASSRDEKSGHSGGIRRRLWPFSVRSSDTVQKAENESNFGSLEGGAVDFEEGRATRAGSFVS